MHRLFVTENLVDRAISGDTKNVLIFDGDCGFCTTSARWIEARGARVQAWQTLDLTELRLTVADVDEAAWWIDETGKKAPRSLGNRPRSESRWRWLGVRWRCVGTSHRFRGSPNRYTPWWLETATSYPVTPAN